MIQDFNVHLTYNASVKCVFTTQIQIVFQEFYSALRDKHVINIDAEHQIVSIKDTNARETHTVILQLRYV